MPSKTPNNPAAPNTQPPQARPDLAFILFLTLLGSYAYFWQTRDWNSATRLMLTYAMVDRHQLEINGLEEQAGERRFNLFTGQGEIVAGDLARVGSDFYTDKAPGQSLIGAPVYLVAKMIGDLPDHPLHMPALRHWSWPADYWITLGTSGTLTAVLGVVIYAFCLRFGASHFSSVLLGLAYGLASPAFVYATLFYGHQAAAFCGATSFFLIYRAAHEKRANLWNMLLAGLLAGFSVVTEYQTAGISAVLAVYAVIAIRRVQPILMFLISAGLAACLLMAYNYRAFGHPLELSYAHEVSKQFQAVHSTDNPLGLRLPRWEVSREILLTVLWGRFRGLGFYAPVLLAAPLGLLVLVGRRFWGTAFVTLGAFGWMLAVNVGYPLWEGGWCTGPRFLLPAIPFAFLAVGGLLGIDRGGVLAAILALATLAGGVMVAGCTAVGGRFPPNATDPVLQIVVPHLRGEIELGNSAFAGGSQFEWNIGRWLVDRHVPPGRLPPEPSPWQSLQLAPLGTFWLLMATSIIWRTARARPPAPRGVRGQAVTSRA